jgi:ABC-type glycerol-3-phosphate transport system permease component
MKRLSGTDYLVYAILVAAAAFALFPLYHLLATSLKSAPEYMASPIGWPAEATVASYRYLIVEGRILRFFANNLLLVPLGTAAYIAVCLAAGFAFGQLRFRLRLPLFLVLLFLQIFPQMLLSMQVFRLAASFGLIDTYLGVILVWVAYFAPFGTYIMTTYFSTIPREIIESARIDGASTFRILAGIMAPLAAPMLGTLAILGVQQMWNELPFSLLLLQDDAKRTIILGIAMLQGEYGMRIPDLSAAIMIASAVPILLLAIFQRRITLGTLIGSVKG